MKGEGEKEVAGVDGCLVRVGFCRLWGYGWLGRIRRDYRRSVDVVGPWCYCC